MAEIVAAYTCSWRHRVAIGESNANLLLRVEKRKERLFLRMLRTSGVARRWTNASIALANQLLCGQALVRCIGPIFCPYASVKMLRKGLGESVG